MTEQVSAINQSSDGQVLAQSQYTNGLWQGYALVTGMDCAACAAELQWMAKSITNLNQLEVNPASGLSHWMASDPEAIEVLRVKARKLGYEFVPTGRSASEDVQAQLELKRRVQGRSRFLRMLVAMLCMMQIMMYSAPEYFYTPQEIGLSEAYLLRWAQWTLSLPILLYCGVPFFTAARRALLARHWVMDHAVSAGILIAFFTSSVQMHQPESPVWFDSLSMLVSFLLFTRWLTERKTAESLAYLSSMAPDLPLQAARIDDHSAPIMPREGDREFSRVAVLDLRPGDWVQVLASQVVPVDTRLPPGHPPVLVSESIRSGESQPLLRRAGQALAAGSVLIGSGGQSCAWLEVTESPASGSVGRLGSLIFQSHLQKPTHQSMVDQITPWFSAGVIVAAIGGALVWLLMGASVGHAVSVLIAVLIVTCPCALALALPLVHLFALVRLGSAGVLARNTRALESMERISIIGLDKTGTLTAMPTVSTATYGSSENSPKVRTVLIEADRSSPAQVDQQQALAMVLAMALQSAHPLAQILASELSLNQGILQSLMECSAHEELAGLGVAAQFEISAVMAQGAALESGSISGPIAGRLGKPEFCGWTSELPSRASESLIAAAIGGWRWLFAVELEKIPDQTAILQNLASHSPLALLSGDRKDVVACFMPHVEFSARLGELSPSDKKGWVEARQKAGDTVLVCGDGLNDAPAFAIADVSVAACGSTTLSASQADFLLLQPGLAGLEQLFQIGRQTNTLGRQNLLWAMAYNAVAVPAALLGYVTPAWAAVGMGISSVVVVLNSLRMLTGNRST